MGGTGSGPSSIKARAWELAELCESILSYVERSRYDESTAEKFAEWLKEQQRELDTRKGRLKDACERDAHGTGNGKS